MEKKLSQLEQEREDYEMVRYRMDDEGMEYCFKHYSTFEEIEDEEFHKLREEFLESSTVPFPWCHDSPAGQDVSCTCDQTLARARYNILIYKCLV